MIASSEKEQLARAREMDLVALGEIYDTYSPEIFKHVIKVLGDETLAEDCVAETFSRFLIALNKGKGPKDYLRAYLYKIAHNWITDYFRKQPERLYELDETISNKNDALPERIAEMEMEINTIRRALTNLTQEQREVITLRYLEGWSTEEIAKVTKKPTGAVKALQHRGLNSMRKFLQYIDRV